VACLADFGIFLNADVQFFHIFAPL
jgi:hypothetical protein